MCVRLFSLTVLVVSLALESHAADYTKLLYRDCGSKGGVIENIDLTPMPVFNPGEAYLTLVAQLNRPVSTYPIELDIRDRHIFFPFAETMETSLNIIRTVSGITLPIKCYLVAGKPVGSCTYASLCELLQDLLDEFQPATCPAGLAQFGIDCRCPFNIKPQRLNIDRELLNIPDASKTAASFLASGNFNITVIAKDTDNPGAAQPYGCVNLLLTIKQKK